MTADAPDRSAPSSDVFASSAAASSSTKSPIDWNAFQTTIDEAKNVVLTAHIRPDGDSVGSLLGLGRALEKLGKNVLLVNGHSVPPNLAFLDPEGEIRKFSNLTPKEREFVANADLVMSLDTRAWAQLGDAAELFKTPGGVKAVLDHHALGDPIGAVEFVDPNADSTGSLVFEALAKLGVVLTPELALPIFVAISTDTGWFRFASTNSETLRRAAALVDAGVRPDSVYKQLFEQESLGRLKLIGAALTRCQPFLDRKGIFISLRQKDFDDAGALPTDSEDVVNIALQVVGVEVAEIAIEQKDGSVKASFRSRCDLDCAKLAAEFGGGGHRQAAGASLDGDLETASKRLMAKTAEHYAALKK